MLFDASPNLQVLRLTGWKRHDPYNDLHEFTKLTHLVTLDLHETQLLSFPKLPPSLCSLDMSSMYDVCSPAVASQINIDKCLLPNLESLELNWCPNLRPTMFLKLLEQSTGKVKRLGIQHCQHIDQTEIKLALAKGYLDRAVDLNLAGLIIDDDLIGLLAQDLSHLRRLDLSNTRVTGIGVKALVTKPEGRLDWLGLNNCTSVSIDAVELARSIGITVNYRNADNLKFAKKVRYG